MSASPAWRVRHLDGAWGRTLALFDRWGIRKRPYEVRICLSVDGKAALIACAAERRVCPSGLAAYLVEAAVREAS